MKTTLLLAGAIAVAVAAVGCGKNHTDSILEPAPVALCHASGGLTPETISVPPDEVEFYLAQGDQIGPCANDPGDDGGGIDDPAGDDDDDDGGIDDPAGDDDDDDGGIDDPAGDDDDDDDDGTLVP